MNNLHVDQLVLGELNTNCYILSHDQTQKCLIIDPADSGETINQWLLEQQLTPLGIILTHGHFDHVLATLEVKTAWNIPVYLHQDDNFLLTKAQASARHWLGRMVDPIPPADKDLSSSSHLQIEVFNLTVVPTPGHTPGSVCISTTAGLFTGDTIFADCVGRTDFSYSDPNQLLVSLRELNQLDPQVTIFPGHGPSSTLGSALQVISKNHHI